MFDYKLKKERKKRVGHQTPGKQKGKTCQADWKKKYFAKTSRSYKHKEYGNWLTQVRKWNSS